MYGFFIVLHIVICFGMMISVLMQSAKGEGLAGAFGGTSLTGTVFGGRGAAPFLAKATTGLAVAFFLSCVLLTFLSPVRQQIADNANQSAVQQAAQERATQTPPVQQQQTPTQLPAGTDNPADAPVLNTPPPGSDAAGQQQGQPAGGQPAEQTDEQTSGGGSGG